MLAVSTIIIVLLYVVDGSVMVTFTTKKVNTFVLLDMNCKINSLGVLKSLILNTMTSWSVTIFRKYIKTVLCLLTGVGITAIRKLCRPDCYCFSTWC